MSESVAQPDSLELDTVRYELRRGDRVLRLEKIPMELLILLAGRKDQLVGRREIIEKLWGKDVFLDTEQGVNTAVRKIRLALGDDPENPKFLQTVVGKGYRFVGPLTVVGGGTPSTHTAEALPSEATEKENLLRKTRGHRWRAALVAAGIIVVGAFAVQYSGLTDRWFPRHPAIGSIAVLPLKNFSGNSADDYFADGMTDELITNLAKISSLRVTSFTSVAPYKATTKPLPQIARELHVDAVLEGSVVRAGDQIRITTQLIYGPSDKHLWAEEYQRALRDVLTLQREVARDVAQEVRVTLTPSDQRRLATAGAIDPAAYESYLRGRSYWNQRNEASLHKAIEQFSKAVEIEPTYAAAYSGIADCYTTMGYLSYMDPLDAFPQARTAAMKAIELDPTLAEAHASLAYYNLYHAWDWEEAEKEFKRAIEFNPNYATAHEWYSYYLSAMGRFDEAWTEIQRARELDPLAVIISTDIGFNYFYRHDYDGAISQLRQTLAVSPEFPLAHLWLGRAYQQKKLYAEAIDEFNKTDAALPEWPVTIAGIGNAYGEWGKRMEAKEVLTHLSELSNHKYVTPYGVALVYAGLDDKDQAFAWLYKAFPGTQPLAGLA